MVGTSRSAFTCCFRSSHAGADNDEVSRISGQTLVQDLQDSASELSLRVLKAGQKAEADDLGSPASSYASCFSDAERLEHASR